MNVMNYIISSVIIVILGCIFHFTYDWSGKKKWVGIFSAVNESTWEHIKIGLTGAFLYSIFDAFSLGVGGNFLPAKAAEFLAIIIIMPALYYFIEIFLKKFVLIVDILEFVATIFAARLVFFCDFWVGKFTGVDFCVGGSNNHWDFIRIRKIYSPSAEKFSFRRYSEQEIWI